MSEAYKTQLIRGLVDATLSAATIALSGYAIDSPTKAILVPAIATFIATLGIRVGWDGTADHKKRLDELAARRALVPPAEPTV